MKNKYTKTETSIIICLICFAICWMMYMFAFHSAREENRELKIKLEQCSTKN